MVSIILYYELIAIYKYQDFRTKEFVYKFIYKFNTLKTSIALWIGQPKRVISIFFEKLTSNLSFYTAKSPKEKGT